MNISLTLENASAAAFAAAYVLVGFGICMITLNPSICIRFILLPKT